MKKLTKLFKPNFSIIGLLFLLVFIPLYPKSPLANISGTYVAIRWEDILVAVILFFWFIGQAKGRFKVFKDPVGRLIFLYWLVGLLSLVSALLVTKNIVPHIALLHYLRRIEYMSLFFVGLTAVRSLTGVVYVYFVTALVSVGVFVYGIGQKFYGWPVVSTMNSEFSKGLLLRLDEWARVNSTFAGHYDLAAYLVILLAISFGCVFFWRHAWQKLFNWLVIIGAYYLLILTASRVSFVAYLLSVTIVLILLKKFRPIIPIILLSILLMLFSDDISQRYAATFKINLAFLSSRIPRSSAPANLRPTVTLTPTPVSSQTPSIVLPLITSTPTPTPTLSPEQQWQPTTEVAVAYSSGIRFDVEWPRAGRALAKNPLLGTGYSSLTLATDNDYLRLLGETGLMGFTSFGLIFLWVVKYYFRVSKPAGPVKGFLAGMVGAIVGMFANAVFIDVFESSKVAFIFWGWLGLMVGYLNYLATNDPNKITKK